MSVHAKSYPSHFDSFALPESALPYQCQLVTVPAPIALDKLPNSLLRIVKVKRTKPIVHLVQHSGNIQERLEQPAVTLNIASHAVCDMRQGLAGSRVVCIFVNDA